VGLVRTSLLNGIAVSVKVLSALIINKVLAVYLGPGGYGLVGQLQNAVSIVSGIAGGLISTGVTKATAEHFDDQQRQRSVWSSAFQIVAFTSLLTSIALLIFHTELSQFLFNGTQTPSTLVILAFCLPAIAANNLLLAMVNGKKEVGIFVATNIFSTLISVVLIWALSRSYGLTGALLAIVLAPVFSILPIAILLVRTKWFGIRFLLTSGLNKPVIRELLGFAAMGLTTALAAPISYLLIRSSVSDTFGPAAAGFWQASWKISELYLLLITSTLALYYLPRLAEIRSAHELRDEVKKVYVIVMPIVVAGAITIYFLRDFIIATFFTAEFAPMRDLFAWQLVGDVFKVGSWVLAYLMLARSMVKAFIFTEILFSFSLVLVSQALLPDLGVRGVSVSYAINYFVYWVVVAFLVRSHFAPVRL
jgi:PST family polysaccharide transporter